MAGPAKSQSIAGDAAAALELNAAELLHWRRLMLQAGGGTNACAADLDWLLDLAGGVRWSELQALLLHPERRVTLQRPLSELAELWQRHLERAEPLQYLVGLCPWRDLEISVAPGVLIPRQETEQLAELALQLAAGLEQAGPLLWADLGTGSGCLALALARGLSGSLGLAVDASAEALQQAAANLGAFLATDGLSDAAAGDPAQAGDQPPSAGVQLQLGDWWQAIKPWWGRLQLVVSNPPYIPSAVVDGLDPVVRDHEPRLALDGGADGLEAIRRIVAGAPHALAPGGLLVLEHHHDQSDAVLAMLEAAGLEDCSAHHDLEGVRRFVSASRACRPGDRTAGVDR